MLNEKEVIKLWKELDIKYVDFVFSCGGDSMNDTEIIIYNNKGKEITNESISNYIDDVIYQRVEFYVNSDGHYIGESGTVMIELDGDSLMFSKSAQSEWNESFTDETTFEVSDKEAKFISDYVLNINGGDGSCVVNYKKDCIFSDEEEEIVAKLEERINDFVEEYEPEDLTGELSDWYSYTTNESGEELILENNNLTLYINKSETVYRDEQ